MTAYHYLCLLVIGLVAMAWSSHLFAAAVDDEVTVAGSPPPTSAKSTTIKKTTSTSTSGTTTSTHKTSHHKTKKKSTTGSTTTASSSAKKSAKTAVEPSTPLIIPMPVPLTSSVAKASGISSTPITITAPAKTAAGSSAGPEVSTGLPVARHGSGSAIYAYNALPAVGTLPRSSGTTSYQVASAFPITANSSLGSSNPSYLPAQKSSVLDNFNFTNFSRTTHHTYPWKYDIITTEFWIGEAGTTISSTDNIASAWDTNWREDNHGTDTPGDRDGYAPAGHAAMTNPFYVALPFNDLAFPDKARRWVPASWFRPPRNGKQISACKDRWVEIKNAQGDTCYAQWEDVGPLRYDHAEYVFGDERPDTYTRAGLDVSPAVAQYLNIDGRNRLTRWRFVDDADVQPGIWLRYDEEALLLNAIKNAPSRPLPIQSARAPIDDQTDIDSNQKKLDKAKG